MNTYISNDFVLNISNCQISNYNLTSIDEKHFAEQITIMDRVCYYYIIIYMNVISSL